MATVAAEWLEKDYCERGTDALIRDFIAGKHDFQKRAVREVLGDGLYLECCKRRVDIAVSQQSVEDVNELLDRRMNELEDRILKGWKEYLRSISIDG